MKALKAGLASLLLITTASAQAVTESFNQGRFASAAAGSTDWHASTPKQIIPQASGYLVIGGNQVEKNQNGALTTGTKLYALKLTTSLSRDTSFGVNGVKALELPDGYYYRNAVAKSLASGKILVAAEAIHSGMPDIWQEGILLTRLNADATPDTTFGTDGSVIVNMPCLDDSSADGPSLNVQADGRIVLAGTYGCPTTGRQGFVARFSANGVQEAGFGSGGFLVIDPRTTSTWVIHSRLDSEGRLVLAGDSARSTSIADWNYDAFVARVTLGTTPAVDTTFNGTGHRIVVSPDDSSSWPTGLQTEGTSILLASSIKVNDEGESGGGMVTRVLASGAADVSFGTVGSVVVAAGGFEKSFIREMLPVTSGYLLLGSLNDRRAIIKLKSNGDLDTGDGDFVGTGFWRSMFSNRSSFVSGLFHDGSLLAAGQVVTEEGTSIDPENELEKTDYVISRFSLSEEESNLVTSASSSSSSGGGSMDFLWLLLATSLLFARRRYR